MIYKGVQARLIQEAADGCLAETISRRDPKILKQRQDALREAGQATADEETLITDASAPNVDADISCYAPEVRLGAARVIRRGAVKLDIATAEQKAAAGIDEDAPALAPIALAFRWVGQEHSSARNAYALDDISLVPLRQLSASPDGPGHSSDTLIDNERQTAEKRTSIVRFANKLVKATGARKEARRKSWNTFTFLVEPEQAVEDHTRKHAKVPRNEDFPIFFQLLVDNQTWHVAPTKHGVPVTSRATVTYGVRGGAIIQLPALRIDALPSPNAAEEVLRTVTFHVWNGMRPGLRKHHFICDCNDHEKDKSSRSLGDADLEPKATHAPDAIFHFELTTEKCGAAEAAEEDEETAQPAAQSSFFAQGERALYQLREESCSSSSEVGQVSVGALAVSNKTPSIPSRSSSLKVSNDIKDPTAAAIEEVKTDDSAVLRAGPQYGVVSVDRGSESDEIRSTSVHIDNAEHGQMSRTCSDASRLALNYANDAPAPKVEASAMNVASTSANVAPRKRLAPRKASLEDAQIAKDVVASREAEPEAQDEAVTGDKTAKRNRRWSMFPNLLLHKPSKKSDAKTSQAKIAEEESAKAAPQVSSEAPKLFVSARNATEDVEKRLLELCGQYGADFDRSVGLMDILGAAGTHPDDAQSVKGLETLFVGIQEKRDEYGELIEQRQAAGKQWRSIVRTELKTIDKALDKRISYEKASLEAIARKTPHESR